MPRVPTAIVLLLAGGFAGAEPLSYEYAYYTKTKTDVGVTDAEGDIYGVFKEIGPRYHLFASQGDAGFYVPGTGRTDTTVTRLGGGARFRVHPDVLLAPQAAVLRGERTRPLLPEVTDTGHALLVDARWRFLAQAEATANATWSDMLGSDTTSFTLGLVYHPARWLAVGVLHNRDGSLKGTDFTLRWYY